MIAKNSSNHNRSYKGGVLRVTGDKSDKQSFENLNLPSGVSHSEIYILKPLQLLNYVISGDWL
jgi:hypothetical protein